MENEFRDFAPEILDDLCRRDREMEKTRALNVELCDLILSSGQRRRREWVPVTDSLRLDRNPG